MVDLAIVGGGPAGLAAAIAARRRGLSVIVLEQRAAAPIDKPCGEGLMPGGVAALERLGIAVEGRPFRGIRYVDVDTGVVAEGPFLGGQGLGLRRTRLHSALSARAAELGADLRYATRATVCAGGEVETGEGPLRARVVVGADGLHSRVRRAAGLDRGPARRGRYGIRRHFATEPWANWVEVYWAAGVEAYVTPVGPCEVGIAMLWSPREAGAALAFSGLLERFPALSLRIGDAPASSPVQGAGPFHQRTRGVVRGNVALLGDASGYVDPITGEGLSLAFREAEALAEAVVAGDLGAYARAHARIVAGYVRLTTLLLIVQRRPALRRLVLRAFAASPTLFSRLIAANDGGLPPRGVR